MLVNYIRGAKQSHHMKEGILMFVEEGRCREGAGDEVEGCSGGAGMQALESLQCLPSVKSEYLQV